MVVRVGGHGGSGGGGGGIDIDGVCMHVCP